MGLQVTLKAYIESILCIAIYVKENICFTAVIWVADSNARKHQNGSSSFVFFPSVEQGPLEEVVCD